MIVNNAIGELSHFDNIVLGSGYHGVSRNRRKCTFMVRACDWQANKVSRVGQASREVAQLVT
jgi:hypothetical protein